MAHAVVRTDNLSGTIDGSRLLSLVAETNIDNGNIVVRGVKAEGERETYIATAPEGAVGADKAILVAGVEMDYEGYKSLDEYYNAAGDKFRGYLLKGGDEFSVTADAFANASAAPTAVDADTRAYVATSAGATKLTVVNTAENALGEIVAVEAEGGYVYYVIRVAN